MPSFDIVSKLDMQEIENAIFNATKEINQRYDFKGSNTSISRNENVLVVETEDELKAKQVNELLIGHFVKRSVDPKALEIKSTEPASGNRIRQTYELLEGIEQDTSKKIHQHGSLYEPKDLIKKATGKEFSVEPFIVYLEEKFTDLYFN